MEESLRPEKEGISDEIAGNVSMETGKTETGKTETESGKTESRKTGSGNNLKQESYVGLLGRIKEVFCCKEQDVRMYSPLSLAYIGDGIYDLVIRSVVVERANRSANDLHRKTVKYVKAEAQAAMVSALAEELNGEEEAVYKRGRNAKSYTAAKNASKSDYRKATGFEALMGYLYLTDQMDRLLYLVKTGIERAGMEI